MRERKPNVILIQERKRRGWSQKRLADELNALTLKNGEYGAATEDMVRKWEKGIHTPSPFYLSRLCTVFECTTDQIGVSNPLPTPSQAPELPSIPASSTLIPALHIVYLTTIIDHWRAWLHDLQVLVQQETQRMDKISRRETLLALVALPSALMMVRSTPPIEETIARYAASITACWNLYFDGGAEEIRPYLNLHLPQLTALAKTPSKYQKSAAALSSQAYRLEWLLALQDQDFGRALSATREGAICGEIAGDENLIAASHARGAHVYFHLKNPTQQMRQYNAAMHYSSNASPLLKSWINMSMAENYASLHQIKEAEKFIDLACTQFPDHPEDDPAASYVEVSQYRLSMWEARTALRLSQPQKALDAMQCVEQGIPEAFTPNRIELLNQRLVALCDLGELEETCDLFEIVERGSRQSKLRYNEVCEVYSTMCTKWPTEKRVLGLETMLRR